MSNVIDALTALRDEVGSLTADLVVEAATPEDHPLHSRFEWDNTIAGHAYRLTQASSLLRVTFKPAPTQPRELRAFLAVKGKDTRRSDYVPVAEAMGDEFTRKLVLADMEREWRIFRHRYEDMAEFAAMIVRDLGMGEAS